MFFTSVSVLICSRLRLAEVNDMLLAAAACIRGLRLSFRGRSSWKSTGACGSQEKLGGLD